MTSIKLKAQELRKDPVFIWTLVLSLFVLFVCLSFIIFFWRRLPPVIPFYYSLPWGEEQLASPVNLIGLLISSLMIYLLGSVAAILLRPNYIYYARLMLIGSTAFCLLATITIIQIILLIT